MHGVNEFKNRIKKDSLMCAIIVIAIIIAYIAFFYALSCSLTTTNEREDIKRLTTGVETKAVYFEYKKSGDWIEKAFNDPESTTYFTGLTLYFDKKNYEGLVTMYINPPSEFPFNIISGEIPGDETDEKAVVLGIKRKGDTFRRNGQDYIRICGEDYLVTGYISEETSSVVDDLVIMFWNKCGDNVKASIDYFASTPAQICVVVEGEPINEWYDKHFDYMERYAYNIRISDNYMEMYDVDNNEYYIRLSFLLYALSVFILIIVVKYWIRKHKEELIIRRIVGYERYQLLFYLSKKVCVFLLFVSMICFIVHMLLKHALGTLIGMKVGFSELTLAVCFFLLTFIILLIYPIKIIFVEDVIGGKDYYTRV